MLPEILQRRSTEHFGPSPVSAAKLERVLEAGRLAPSAKNRQEWRFVVVQKKALREKIREAAFGEEKVGQAPANLMKPRWTEPRPLPPRPAVAQPAVPQQPPFQPQVQLPQPQALQAEQGEPGPDESNEGGVRRPARARTQ